MIHFLAQFETIAHNLAACMATLPHDADTAYLHLEAAKIDLDRMIAEAHEEAVGMEAMYAADVAA